MNKTEKIVLQAMQDRSPSLVRQLKAKGELESFVTERASEILDEIVTSTQEIATKQGAQKENDLIKKAGMLRMAEALATERVLGGEMLEFPQDAIFLSRREETTPSEIQT